MKLRLIYTPDSILTVKARKVTVFNTKLQSIIEDMKYILLTCKNPEGVGLAAPQVGLALQIFIMKSDTNEPIRTFINPTILKKIGTPHGGKKAKKNILEGCLSVKNVWSEVDRYTSVVIRYQDLDGSVHTYEGKGFESNIIQHELDHLQGILFTKRALEQKKTLYRIVKKDNQEEFEPIEL